MWLLLISVLLAQTGGTALTNTAGPANTAGSTNTAASSNTADFDAAGKSALDRRDFRGAIEAFRQAVAAAPSDYAAHFNLGFAYTMAGQDSDAATEYKQVLELHPGVYEAQVNLANSLFRLSRFADADGAYRAALQLKPDAAAAESGLGRTLAREDNFTDAEPHYRKAAALDPSYKDFLMELASLYEDKHHSAESIAILREFPANATAQEHLGALLLEAGKLAEAIAPLEFAVAQSPTPANRLQLAQAYSKEKQLAKAEVLAAAVLANTPDDNEIRMFYGRLLRDERKFPEAAAQFQAAAARQPQLVAAWNELAGVLLVSDQYQPALDAFDHVRALGAETPANLFFRATALDHMHRAKEALANYNGFLAGSKGAFPNQEFQARQRVLILEKELGKR
jgi:tetratricopeptide (TPR) repeat protein